MGNSEDEASTFSDADKCLYDRVRDSSRKGDLEGMLPLLLELVKRNKHSGKLRAMLANAYDDLGQFEKAYLEYKEAIRLAPNSELVSLGFFHCLWSKGRRDEALEEAKRFLSDSPSEEYVQIVRAINDAY